MCNCIDLLGAELLRVSPQTMLDVSLNIVDPALPVLRLKIATEKINTRSRLKPKSIVCTYCPVCGEKYAKEDQS